MSKANVKTNRVQNGPTTTNGVWPLTNLLFLKNLFQLKVLSKIVDLGPLKNTLVPATEMFIFILFLSIQVFF